MSNHATMASLLDGSLSVNKNCKVTNMMFRSEFGPMTKSQFGLVRCLEPQKCNGLI